MVIYEMRPVIDCRDLQDAVNIQFDTDICEIANLLFDDNYNNDSYKSFYFNEMEEYKYPAWQNEEEIRLRNLIRRYLKDILPEYDSVLIDVSW